MRVLFSCTRGVGHIQPLLPYARELQRRGHDVLVTSPASLNATVVAAGLAHVPFDHPGDAGLAPIWNRLRELPADQATLAAMREIFAGLAAATALPNVLETMRSFRPDVVVRDSVEFASLVAAEAAGVAHARVAVHLCSFEERYLAPTFAPVDALRKQAGLAPDDGASLLAEPVFSAFPPSLEDPAVARSGREPLRAQMPSDAGASGTPSHWAPPTGGAPHVYITFGTIAGGSPQTQLVFRAALEAMAGLPVRALLTTGPAMQAEALGVVPPNVHVEAWVPQRQVLPHVVAVVCHGGSGTVLGTLAASLPLVVAPMFADQPYNAQQIARVGAGVAITIPDAASLRAAVERVLDDAALRTGARRIADEMAALPTLDTAVDAMVALARAR